MNKILCLLFVQTTRLTEMSATAKEQLESGVKSLCAGGSAFAALKAGTLPGMDACEEFPPFSHALRLEFCWGFKL